MQQKEWEKQKSEFSNATYGIYADSHKIANEQFWDMDVKKINPNVLEMLFDLNNRLLAIEKQIIKLTNEVELWKQNK